MVQILNYCCTGASMSKQVWNIYLNKSSHHGMELWISRVYYWNLCRKKMAAVSLLIDNIRWSGRSSDLSAHDYFLKGPPKPQVLKNKP